MRSKYQGKYTTDLCTSVLTSVVRGVEHIWVKKDRLVSYIPSPQLFFVHKASIARSECARSACSSQARDGGARSAAALIRSESESCQCPAV